MAAVTSPDNVEAKDLDSAPKSAASRKKFSIAIPPRLSNGTVAPMKTPTLPLKSPDDTYSNDGILGKTRRRGMSNSSADQDNLMDGTIDHEQDGNPRKRSNADTIDYPRRRATIAVCCGFLLCRALILLLMTYTVRDM